MKTNRLERWSLVALLALCVVGARPAFADVAAAPRKITYEQAASFLGRGVYVGTAAAMPPKLLDVLHHAAINRPGRTNVYFLSTFAPESHFAASVSDQWHPNLFFVSKPNRKAASNAHSGQATLHRSSLFEFATRINRDKYAFDTVVLRVSPPDNDGMVSLGANADLTLPALRSVIRRGGNIIAEVNPNVPHAHGNRIAYTDLTAVIDADEPIRDYKSPAPDKYEHKIADNVARLIPTRRRATIQIGIGSALNALGGALDKKRIALWSEMGGEWLVPLMTANKGKAPALRKGNVSFLLGTNKLYDLARDNPALKISGSDVINDPVTISSQQRMRAINTALEVDLFGNVNAEQIGPRVISSPGGQPDFMKGAASSKDGRAIMALRSIHPESGVSSIVLGLQGPVTTPKQHVDHVVTEWGATEQLRSLSDGARAYQVISVAHPLHRAELAEVALKRGLISQAECDKLRRSIAHSVRLAAPAFRREVADSVFAKGLISETQHRAAVAGLQGVTQ